MQDPAAILIPGGLRLRATEPLIGPGGACTLLYDLERGRLLEVPEEFTFHIAVALETGNLDEGLVGWLATEDLLTYDGRTEPEPGAVGRWAGSGEVTAGAPGGVYLAADGLHCRLDDEDELPPSTLDALLAAGGASAVTLHLRLGAGADSRAVLQRTIEEACSRAQATGQRLAFAVSADPRRITPALATLLAAHPVRLRVPCPPVDGEGRLADGAAAQIEAGLDLLLAALGERLTVHAVLGHGRRLADLWSWARRRGLHRLDATKVGGHPWLAGLDGHAAEVRSFRDDLLTVCEEMASELGAGRRPLLYEPVLRVVGRMLAGDTSPAPSGYLGLVSNGRVCPVSDSAGAAADTATAVGDVPNDAAATACDGCWARHLCARSTWVVPGAAGPDRFAALEERCDLWRTEVAAGLFFFHRLRQDELLELLALPGSAAERTPEGHRLPGWRGAS